MSWLEALILGIVQGLTEFLPVSSSGHLEIGQALLGTAGEENLTFAIIVHAATVLSTLVILWHEVAQLFKGTFTNFQWNSEKDYVAKILVSMIPVFIVGMFFKDQVESFFGNGLLLVGICLLITAGLLALSEWLQKSRQTVGHEVTHHRSGASLRCTAGSESFGHDHRYRTAVWREERECGAVLVPDGTHPYLRRSFPRPARPAQRRDDEFLRPCAGCRGICGSVRCRLFRL